MPKFSPKLILDTISCFKEEDGVVLTESEAVEVLDSLAGLYLAFAGVKASGDGGGGGGLSRAADDTPPPDLISPHSC